MKVSHSQWSFHKKTGIVYKVTQSTCHLERQMGLLWPDHVLAQWRQDMTAVPVDALCKGVTPGESPGAKYL